MTGNTEFTEDSLCWEHCNEVDLKKNKCVCNVLGGYFVHFLVMYLQCTCQVHHPLSLMLHVIDLAYGATI